jgi:HAD superfamily hydrolase (TIGR01509 family)
MRVEIPIGLGEFVDRLIIARLKQRRLKEPQAHEIAVREVETLELILTERAALIENMPPHVRIAYGALSSLNRRVWDLEERIRSAASTESIDSIAREVRMLNDVRSAIKVRVDAVDGGPGTSGKAYRGQTDDLEWVRAAPWALLLDLDGVLADTEKLKNTAHVETVDELGGRLPTGFYADMLGESQRDVAAAALECSRIEAPVERYNEIFRRRYVSLIRRGVRPVIGALELVASARDGGLRVCVVTSSSLALAGEVLTSIGLDLPSFNLVISADDSPCQKPSSEPYLSALQALWSEPGRTLAIEDAAPGVASAAGVGIPVVAVRHSLNERQDLGAARYVVEDLTDSRLLDDVRAMSRDEGART